MGVFPDKCIFCGSWDIVEVESGCSVGIYLWEIYGCNECGRSFKRDYVYDEEKKDWRKV